MVAACGIFTAVEYLISSLLMMLTIIGIPFGMQTLKLAGLALWPFDKKSEVGTIPVAASMMNILWIFLGGIWICLSFGFQGYIVHYHYRNPFLVQHFKLCIFGIICFEEDIVTV